MSGQQLSPDQRTEGPPTRAVLERFWATAQHHGQVEAARAALRSLLAEEHFDPSTWLALHRLEAEDGRWNEALSLAEAAERHASDDVRLALLLPATLARFGRLAEAQAGYRSVASRFTADYEGLAALAELSWTFDPETTFWAIQEAVGRGFRHRDWLIEQGILAAGVLGEFEAGRGLCEHLDDPEFRVRSIARLENEAEAWRRHEWEAQRRFPEGVTVADIEELSRSGEPALGVHLTWRALLAGCSDDEHAVLHDLAQRFGWHRTLLIYYAAHTCRRHPEHPGCMFRYACWLLLRGAFADAGAILALPMMAVIHDDLRLSLLTFCCAGGGLEPDALATELASAAAGHGAELGAAFLGAADGRAGEQSASADPLAGLRRLYRPSTSRRPRLAVCISGQLRSFRPSWRGTSAAIAAWDPVVFVDTWADVGTGFGAHDTVDRCLPLAVRQRLPEIYRQKSRFGALAPRSLEAMARTAVLDASELQAVYGTPHVQVHDEAAFEAACAGKPGEVFAGNLNQAKMFFTLHTVNAQKAAYEAEHGFIFDAVLRLRPDKMLHALGASDVEWVMRERVLLTDYFLPGGVGDQHNLCSSEVFDRLGEIWPALEAHGHSRYFPGSSGRYNEYLVAEHMISQGVRIGRHCASFSHGLAPFEADIAALWPAVLQDAAEGPDGDERRVVLTAFVEAVAEQHAAGRTELAVAIPDDAAWLRREPGLSKRAQQFVMSSPRA